MHYSLSKFGKHITKLQNHVISEKKFLHETSENLWKGSKVFEDSFHENGW